MAEVKTQARGKKPRENADSREDTNKIWISMAKNNLFYANLALRKLRKFDTVELHGLGAAIASVFEVSQILNAHTIATIDKISTAVTQSTDGRKPEAVIILSKGKDFTDTKQIRNGAYGEEILYEETPEDEEENDAAADLKATVAAASVVDSATQPHAAELVAQKVEAQQADEKEKEQEKTSNKEAGSKKGGSKKGGSKKSGSKKTDAAKAAESTA